MIHAYYIARVLKILEEGREIKNREKENSNENELITQKVEDENTKEENKNIKDTLIGSLIICVSAFIIYLLFNFFEID